MKKLVSAFVLFFGLITLTVGCNDASTAGTAPTTPAVTIPAAPTNVVATPGNAQVSLTWTASTGATSYNVYYSTTTGVTAANGTKIGGLSATSATQTGLINGGTYFFVVTAVNTAGESAASTQVSAIPVPPAPAAPTALTAVAGNAQVALSWTASAGATTYNVYYGTATGVTVGSGTKVGALTGTTYTVTGLTNNQAYFFIVTAVNGGGESPASNQASATPTSGISVSLVPGTAASGTLQASPLASLTFNFPANAVSQSTVATISPIAQADLPVPLERKSMANAKVVPKVQLGDTFLASFTIQLDVAAITTFNVPIGVSGMVPSLTANTSATLAVLQDNTWVDVATFVVDANGAVAENLPSFTLPGLTAPKTYLFYQAAKGTSTAVANFGVALIADDGHGLSDGSDGLQVVHLYDATGNLLATPTLVNLDYPNAGDLDGEALTPDGSQGVMVDGGNTVRFFSGVQTGTPVASTQTLDVGQYGSDGDAIAILPNGDEAVLSEDSSQGLLLLSGILSGTPVVSAAIPTVSNRDGLVLSDDGKVLLARGPGGLTTFAIAPIAPVAGALGGTVSHSFTQLADMPELAAGFQEDGRDGMAISPTDSSRAVLVTASDTGTVQLLTGLTTTPTAGAAIVLPTGISPFAVSISPDGKTAVVGVSDFSGTNSATGGLLLFSGVDTGTLTQVGAIYQPTYTVNGASVAMGYVNTLGITLDGKYVLAGDAPNSALIVVPFTAAGFASAPASVLGNVAIPDNDQLLVH